MIQSTQLQKKKKKLYKIKYIPTVSTVSNKL